MDVDLYVESEVTVNTGFYFVRRSFERNGGDGKVFMSGDQRLIKTFRRWLKFSMYSHADSIMQVGDHAVQAWRIPKPSAGD